MSQTQTEVSAMNLHIIKNAKFVDLMNKVDEQLTASTTITINLQTITNQFSDLTSKLNESLVAKRGSAKTELLRQADEKRDCGITLFTKSYIYSEDAEKSEAASALYHIIKKYGTTKLRNADYASETSLLKSLIENLKAAELTKTVAKLPGLTDWISSLKTPISQFNTVMAERLIEDAGGITYTTHGIRKQTIPVFGELVKFVETFAKLKADLEYSAFIAQLSSTIAYLNI